MTLDLEVERKRKSVLGEERRLRRDCLVYMEKAHFERVPKWEGAKLQTQRCVASIYNVSPTINTTQP